MRTKKTLLVGALGLLAISFAFGPAGTALPDPLGLDLDRYIVSFYTMPTVAPGDHIYGSEVVDVIADLNMVVVKVEDGASFLAGTAVDANVRYTEWDNPAAAVLNFTPNDTRYNDAGHYGSKKIRADVAWDRTLGTTAVKVAMVDSGLKKTHEDITGARVLQGFDFVSNDNDPQDTSGCVYHGSHTTGTAGATTNNAKGIAGISQHNILPIRVFSGPISILCTSSTTQLVNGLKYAGDQGAHVSSNSWGSSGSSAALNDAVQYSHNKGTIHVAAAGNSGACTNCVSYPWKDKGAIVIVVSATDSADAFAGFSSQGPQVDVAAPGVNILSVDGAGVAGYKTLSGTSMATPHVAGVAALIKALNPGFTFTQVESRLTSTAIDLGTVGKDDKFGFGRVDAGAAVF